MTRINAGYAVHRLCRQHLLAELREIKRIPNMITSGKANLDDIPDTFRLGKGHVKFFYNKIGYLFTRYIQLKWEAECRGYNVTDFSDSFIQVYRLHPELFNDWEPTPEAKQLVEARINERLTKMKIK